VAHPDPSPFKTIWYEPRVTMRRILVGKTLSSVILLTSLAGINGALDHASNRNFGEQHSLRTILLGSCLAGPLIAIVAIGLVSFIIKWSGNLLGGVGDPNRIAAAIAWSSLPGLIGLVFWAPQLLIFGSEMFLPVMPTLEAKPHLLAAIIGLDGISVVFSFWGAAMLCFMLAEAQGFVSAWRGLANLAFTVILIVGITFLIAVSGISF